MNSSKETLIYVAVLCASTIVMLAASLMAVRLCTTWVLDRPTVMGILLVAVVISNIVAAYFHAARKRARWVKGRKYVSW